MTIIKLFLLALLSVMLATACSNTKPSKDIGELYSLALDAFMPIDEGLNGGMKYIAIDMSNFKDLDDTDKKQILKHFNKYNVEVMEATLEQLKAKGLYDPNTMLLNGILLRVEKTENSNNQFVVEGSKYRGGLEAIGIKVVVELKYDKWQVTKANATWES
jgi:hypothetical protein